MSGEPGARSVLITGATDGLGKAAALLLAERGYRVFAAGRSAEKRAQLDAGKLDAFVDPTEMRRYVDESERSFHKHLAVEQKQ